jgi:hypothetical protein
VVLAGEGFTEGWGNEDARRKVEVAMEGEAVTE